MGFGSVIEEEILGAANRKFSEEIKGQWATEQFLAAASKLCLYDALLIASLKRLLFGKYFLTCQNVDVSGIAIHALARNRSGPFVVCKLCLYDALFIATILTSTRSFCAWTRLFVSMI